MPTSILTELPLPKSGLMSKLASLLMTILCGSLALYPLLEQFVLPLLVTAFGLATAIVGFRLIRSMRFPNTFLVKVWVVMLAVYFLWMGVAISQGNVFSYAMQDSAGFLLYICAMPVIYLLIHQYRLQRAFFGFIEKVSMMIALGSVALATIIYLVLGDIYYSIPRIL
jgi:hypothetical protein